MAFLRNMTDRFWSYVSPRKTQQRREKDFKFAVPSLPRHTMKRSGSGKSELRSEVSEGSVRGMTPETIVRRWALQTPSQDGSEYVDGAQLPPSPPASLERPYTDFEGETLIDGLAEGMNTFSEEGWDANEETILVDEARYMDEHHEHKELEAEIERARRDAQGQELRVAGWTEDAIFLFQKLGLRGFEPLFPYSWIDDFPVLPTNLFTRKLELAFIKPELDSESDFHAQKALTELFELGGRTRDAVLHNAPIRTAEHHIRQAVLKYNKWALRDAGLDDIWRNLSLFETVSCHKEVSPEVMQARMLRKLNKLADLWRDALRKREMENNQSTKHGKSRADEPTPEVPTLYGVFTSHTLLAFTSYDTHAVKPVLRSVAIFDFGQEGYDVWNSLAVAIFIIHCRNRLLDLQDFLPTPSQTSGDSDPDI
ncbi:hypothetical protein K491DRAFT_755847 [Lophiostoma macrostomum CBS 122681]|uniref:Uncharacterized protein n=1 Tax=Lophiostoma macrostomum CBS 122681 TaxID=1314788 RepID=A0A6A6TFK5_9PLEO|nr:hypothetical protein K491DRAFT_755847 [Lophiostoma macrostomum CBS 122681]